jgi:hypothetical protein
MVQLNCFRNPKYKPDRAQSKFLPKIIFEERGKCPPRGDKNHKKVLDKPLGNPILGVRLSIADDIKTCQKR